MTYKNQLEDKQWKPINGDDINNLRPSSRLKNEMLSYSENIMYLLITVNSEYTVIWSWPPDG